MDARISQHHLTVREQLVLSFLWLGLNIQSAALLPIVIPTQILLFVAPGQVGNAEQATFLGWLSAMGAFFSLVVPPIVGLLSDHTSGPFGRRRPYIVVGGGLTLVSALLLAGAVNAALLVVGLALFQFASNVVWAAYQGLLPDLVPEDQRGEASGYMGLMTILGNVGSLGLAAWLLGEVSLGSLGASLIMRGALIYYVATDLVMLLGIVVTAFGVHELPYHPAAQAESRLRSWEGLRRWLSSNWLAPWRSSNFTIVFLTRFCVMMGLYLFMTFIEYYFANVVRVSNFVQQTAAVATLALVGALLSTLGLGMLSDRFHRAPLVCLATLVMGLPALAFVVAPAALPLWPLGLLFGLGYGAYTSVDWALAIDALPSLEVAAKDLGLWGASSNLPLTLAPLIGSLVISMAASHDQTALGYRLVFALAAFFLLLGAVLVLRVREQRQQPALVEPPTSEAEEQAADGGGRLQRMSMPAPAAARTPSGAHSGGGSQERQGRRGRVNPLWLLARETHAGEARGIMRFWTFWEKLTLALLGIEPVPAAPYGLFQARLTRYRGRSPLVLPDGTRIDRGDRLVELHFANRRLRDAALQSSPWELLRLMRADLRALAAWLQTPACVEVRAVYGVTLLGQAAPRLGFSLRERPRNLWGRADRIFMTGLLLLYHPQGRARLARGTTYGRYPKEVWMSRVELLRRYGGPDGAAAIVQGPRAPTN
ncbi:MFS transporter [Thermogemmatispora carboxidivorans]|uniref:MFS transporter n=1 Tax=Thermogemmatispora carboxidivorans TaxID=1382306 RepID=UPI00069A2DE3|nr:MFS transporter [Thermogemmatispora carboxidivorans]